MKKFVIMPFLLTVAIFVGGCTFVKGKLPSDVSPSTAEGDTKLIQSSMTNISRLSSSLQLLGRSSMSLNEAVTPNALTSETGGGTKINDEIDAKLNKYYNAFLMLYAAFHELGLGKVEYSSDAGGYILIESLSARDFLPNNEQLYIRNYFTETKSENPFQHMSLLLVTNEGSTEFPLMTFNEDIDFHGSSKMQINFNEINALFEHIFGKKEKKFIDGAYTIMEYDDYYEISCEGIEIISKNAYIYIDSAEVKATKDFGKIKSIKTKALAYYLANGGAIGSLNLNAENIDNSNNMNIDVDFKAEGHL